MTPSELVSKFLSPVTQRAFAESAVDKTEDTSAAPALDFETRRKLYAAHGPSLLAKDIQSRIHDLIFGKDIKSLEEAKRMHELLIASLDTTAETAKKKSK